MGSFADCLRKVLKDDALPPRENGDLVLKDKQSKQTVRLTNAPCNLVAVDVSKIGQMSGLKKRKGYDWNKSCDYLLVLQDNRNVRALLIDLKTKLSETNRLKGRKQLRWSRPLLDYLWSIYEIWYYEVRDKARPDCFQISAGYALICKNIDVPLNKQNVNLKPRETTSNKHYAHLKPGETTSERYKNIDFCIARTRGDDDAVSWKRLWGIKEANGER